MSKFPKNSSTSSLTSLNAVETNPTVPVTSSSSSSNTTLNRSIINLLGDSQQSQPAVVASHAVTITDTSTGVVDLTNSRGNNGLLSISYSQAGVKCNGCKGTIKRGGLIVIGSHMGRYRNLHPGCIQFFNSTEVPDRKIYKEHIKQTSLLNLKPRDRALVLGCIDGIVSKYNET